MSGVWGWGVSTTSLWPCANDNIVQMIHRRGVCEWMRRYLSDRNIYCEWPISAGEDGTVYQSYSASNATGVSEVLPLIKRALNSQSILTLHKWHQTGEHIPLSHPNPLYPNPLCSLSTYNHITSVHWRHELSEPRPPVTLCCFKLVALRILMSEMEMLI